MRVLHVVSGLGRGGAEAVLSRLVRCTRPGLTHTVVSLTDEGVHAAPLRAAGIEVHALHLESVASMVGGVPRLRSLMRAWRPDVVQTWMYHADLIGALAAPRGLPVAWGIRNLSLAPDRVKRSTRAVAWLCARVSRWLPDLIISCSSEAARAHVGLGYDATRMLVIPNGYDLERFAPDPDAGRRLRAELGIAPEAIVLACVARWDPLKDHASLLGAFRRWAAVEAGGMLLLVGPDMTPENRELTEIVAATGYRDRIILAGPREDVPAVMNAADLHVLASVGEAFPNVVAEAMACGTPCVVTDVGESAAIVGALGVVVPPARPDLLATAFATALTRLRAEGRVSWGANCRSSIVDRFTLARMVDSYLAAWSRMISTDGRR